MMPILRKNLKESPFPVQLFLKKISSFFGLFVLSLFLFQQDVHCGPSSPFVRIVGSTAVFPFSALIAERLSLLLDEKNPPIIERTGTGAGINLFCGGSGPGFPDGVNTSRPFTSAERNLCSQNGVEDILEIKIGHGGIVLAKIQTVSLFPDSFSLTLEELFKALSKEVLIEGEWVKNPYTTWQQINPSFPPLPISIFGPSSTSGIRDSLKEIIFEPFCASSHVKSCGLFREDGAYIEMPENTMLIIQKLDTNPGALGIVGYPFLDQNRDILSSIPINTVAPTLETILEGTYPLSRPLYFYFKVDNIWEKPVLRTYLEEFMSDAVWGEEGALIEKGLIPLKEEEKNALREKIGLVLNENS